MNRKYVLIVIAIAIAAFMVIMSLVNSWWWDMFLRVRPPTHILVMGTISAIISLLSIIALVLLITWETKERVLKIVACLLLGVGLVIFGGLIVFSNLFFEVPPRAVNIVTGGFFLLVIAVVFLHTALGTKWNSGDETEQEVE